MGNDVESLLRDRYLQHLEGAKADAQNELEKIVGCKDGAQREADAINGALTILLASDYQKALAGHVLEQALKFFYLKSLSLSCLSNTSDIYEGLEKHFVIVPSDEVFRAILGMDQKVCPPSKSISNALTEERVITSHGATDIATLFTSIFEEDHKILGVPVPTIFGGPEDFMRLLGHQARISHLSRLFTNPDPIKETSVFLFYDPSADSFTMKSVFYQEYCSVRCFDDISKECPILSEIFSDRDAQIIRTSPEDDAKKHYESVNPDDRLENIISECEISPIDLLCGIGMLFSYKITPRRVYCAIRAKYSFKDPALSGKLRDLSESQVERYRLLEEYWECLPSVDVSRALFPRLHSATLDSLDNYRALVEHLIGVYAGVQDKVRSV